MIEAGILDGDFVVVRQQPTADNGEIVVAMIDDERDRQALLPGGRAHPAAAGERDAWSRSTRATSAILGKVVALFRRL